MRGSSFKPGNFQQILLILICFTFNLHIMKKKRNADEENAGSNNGFKWNASL
jgi:hypothetical protein